MSDPLYSSPRIAAAGDAALLVELGEGIDEEVNRRVHALARAIEEAHLEGVVDLVPAYRSLLVCYDPRRAGVATLGSRIVDLCRTLDAAGVAPARLVDIPTCYGGEHGPDLPSVAAHAGLSPEEVARIHAAGRYTVFMMGFSPGFAYLGGMSPRIAAPRLETPRTAIPAGSVGIAQQQTGIYPVESPGGWRLIGRTPLALFDPQRTPPTTVQPGDTIRFVPIDRTEYDEMARHQRGPLGDGLSLAGQDAGLAGQAGFEPAIEVITGGGLTTIQDLGRYGFQRYGVPVSGALDRFALRVANLLVVNDEGTAALEMTITGAELSFLQPATIAITGANMQPRVDDQFVPMWRPFVVPAGSVLTFRGIRAGARTYLAVAGGIDVPMVLRSRSTYVRSRLGGVQGRALQAGDLLRVRTPAHPASGRELPAPFFPHYLGGHRVRVLLGPQQAAFTRAGIQTLLSSAYTIAAQSDRMGYRLDGPRVEHRARADIVSDGTPAGAVQVPGDGLPLVLLADRGTTGGYAKIATVITADLPRLAQCRAGDRLFFDLASEDEARAALEREESIIARLGAVPPAAIAPDGRIARPAVQPGGAAAAGALRAHVKAPLPGKLIAVSVDNGEKVSRGQKLAVLEAMKMHNTIAATRDGWIVRRAKAGDQVADGEVLFEITSDEPNDRP